MELAIRYAKRKRGDASDSKDQISLQGSRISLISMESSKHRLSLKLQFENFKYDKTIQNDK